MEIQAFKPVPCHFTCHGTVTSGTVTKPNPNPNPHNPNYSESDGSGSDGSVSGGSPFKPLNHAQRSKGRMEVSTSLNKMDRLCQMSLSPRRR